MIRSKQLATLLLAAPLLGFVSGCHTTVVQPVEVKHVPDDHHDDRDDHHPPPPDHRP
jgi:hypothetical protein